MIIKLHSNDAWFRIKQQEPDKLFTQYLRGRGEFTVMVDLAQERRINNREKFMPKLAHTKPLTFNKSLSYGLPTQENLTKEDKKRQFIQKHKKRGLIYA